MFKGLTGNFLLLGKLTAKMSGKHETGSLDNTKGNSVLKHAPLFMNCNEYTTLAEIKGNCY